MPLDDTLIRHGIGSALAVQLYRSETVSIGLAARIAGTSLEQFMDPLGTIGLPVLSYDPAQLDEELRVLE